MNQITTKIFILVFVLGYFNNSLFASGRTLVCKSQDYHYKFCNADTNNRVWLKHQKSKADCRQGYSWGYTRSGIWVNRGCEAEFEYGDFTYSYDPHQYDYRYSRDYGYDHDDKGKAIAAGVASAAVLAAIIAAKKKDDDSKGKERTDAPNWAVGTFRGRNPAYNAEVELRIYPDGDVKGKVMSTGVKLDGDYRNGSIFFQENEFVVQPSDDGFSLVQASNRNNVVHYYRVS